MHVKIALHELKSVVLLIHSGIHVHSTPLSTQYPAALKSGVPHWSISGFQPHLPCDRVHGKGTELTSV